MNSQAFQGGKSTWAKTCKSACYLGSPLTRRPCAGLSITGSSKRRHMAAGGGRELAGGPPRSLGPAARAAQGLGRKEIHEFLSLNPVAGIPAVDAQGRRTGTERYPGEATRGHTVPPLARRAAPRKRLGLCGGQGTTPVSVFSLRRTPKPRSSTAPSPQSGRQPPTTPHPAAQPRGRVPSGVRPGPAAAPRPARPTPVRALSRAPSSLERP